MSLNPDACKNNKNNGTVLLCDDDFFVVDITGRILKKCNFTVLSCLNAQECLEVFHENTDKIDLVMLDIDLPDMNGMEISRKIKETTPSVPILFFSGFTLNACRSRFNITEDIEVLEKPFREKELKKKIMTLLGRKVC